MRVSVSLIFLNTMILALSGCTPAFDSNFGTTVGLEYPPNHSASLNVTRVPFVTGYRIVSNQGIANTIKLRGHVSDAVVIYDDGRAFVAVRPSENHSFSLQQARAIQDEVRSLDSSVRSVFVTANPNRYADIQQFHRYLARGRTFQGMLLTWRSILRTAWPNADIVLR